MRQEQLDTIAVYDAVAALYDSTIGSLPNYDATIAYFTSSLPKKGAVLDLACGSGVISRKIRAARPHFGITGVDLSPAMLEIARNTVSDGQFIEADICTWKSDRSYDGLVIGFGLPFLNDAEGVKLITRSAKALVPGGVWYISFMQGETEGYEKVSFSPADPIYIYYHDEALVTNTMIQSGVIPEKVWHLDYTESDGSITTDVVVVGRKR